MNVMFVCTGNICRSPMAEAMLRHELQTRGCTGVTVSSRGVWATGGMEMTPAACDALGARGVPVGDHLSAALEEADAGAADLIVVMTRHHADDVARMAPSAREKIVMLKELSEIQSAKSDGADAHARLAALLAGERPAPRRSLDVDDPMNLPLTAYQRCAEELAQGVSVIARILCGPDPSP